MGHTSNTFSRSTPSALNKNNHRLSPSETLAFLWSCLSLRQQTRCRECSRRLTRYAIRPRCDFDGMFIPVWIRAWCVIAPHRGGGVEGMMMKLICSLLVCSPLRTRSRLPLLTDPPAGFELQRCGVQAMNRLFRSS